MANDEMLLQRLLDNEDTGSLQNPDLHAQLTTYINMLIVNDFNELIYLLYRVDVSENKLKNLLKEYNNINSAGIIASLMIERQVEKIISRRKHRRDNNINNEEKW